MKCVANALVKIEWEHLLCEDFWAYARKILTYRVTVEFTCPYCGAKNKILLWETDVEPKEEEILATVRGLEFSCKNCFRRVRIYPEKVVHA